LKVGKETKRRTAKMELVGMKRVAEIKIMVIMRILIGRKRHRKNLGDRVGILAIIRTIRRGKQS
tara:strand:- start:652 stop:843 length:192 start_codon:yes stop_codon:yes gene_type:complete